MKRTWTDYKYIKDLKKGKWTTKELSKLRKVLCEYANDHEIEPEQLEEICGDTTPRAFASIWKIIAEYFPDRSVQSVQNAAKRNFNPNNYKGPWAHWEEQALIRYVEESGHLWKDIAQVLGRTAVNVKDKWKQLGGNRKDHRKKGPWASDELTELVQLIMRNLDLPDMEIKQNPSEVQVIQAIKAHVKPHKQEVMNRTVNWEVIAGQLLTRSSVDCRLKWNSLLNACFSDKKQFTPEQDQELFRVVKNQMLAEARRINFSMVKNGRNATENRARWRKLARDISGGLTLPRGEMIARLEDLYGVEMPRQETIIDYFKKEYNK